MLLASRVPLKQIQEWLGHSDFAITANTYAHLEFNSKVASAQAMTWIDKTSLAQTEEAKTISKATPVIAQDSLQHVLPDLINNALVSDAPVDALLAWLRECDFNNAENVREALLGAIQSYGTGRIGNFEPMTT